MYLIAINFFFSDARVPPDSSRQVFVFLSCVSCASASRYRFQCSSKEQRQKQKHTTVNTLNIYLSSLYIYIFD